MFLMAKTIYLEDIPEKVMKSILKEQAHFKINFGLNLNQSKTVIKMLKDYIRCREMNNFKTEKDI